MNFKSKLLLKISTKKMKKILILLFSPILIFSKCEKPEKTRKQSVETITSNLKDTDSIKNDSLKSKKEVSPIKITAATLLKNDYSHHKDLKLIYKNSGKKNIKAIKFEWFCKNAFDKPANGRYFYAEGRFTEKVISLIKSGESRTEFWEDFSTDADKITKIRAYYIVFVNGTKWGSDDQ
jgi:hypothetical protein